MFCINLIVALQQDPKSLGCLLNKNNFFCIYNGPIYVTEGSDFELRLSYSRINLRPCLLITIVPIPVLLTVTTVWNNVETGDICTQMFYSFLFGYVKG